MPNRASDWLTQGERDLAQARHSYVGGFYEWACFAAQQSAEKAAKALLYALNASARGHSTLGMLERLPTNVAVPRDIRLAASKLDKYYTVTRYPNGFESGPPAEHFLAEEAEEAIAFAEKVLAFCRSNLPG
jgi:HEPN domain-containing protein